MSDETPFIRQRCIATTLSGTPCQTYGHGQSKYCWFHDPDISEEVRTELRRQGGLATRGVPKGRGKTAEELAEILAGQLDIFLERFGNAPTLDTIKAICELVKTNVAVMAHLKVDQGEMGMRLRRTG